MNSKRTPRRYGPRSSRWCHCPLPTVNCTARSKPREKGLGIQSVVEDLCIARGLKLASGSHSDDVLGQPQGVGQGKTRRLAQLVDARSLQVLKSRHEESRHERQPRRLHDEADAETENRAAHEHHGRRVCGTVFLASRSTWYEIGVKFDATRRRSTRVGRSHGKMRFEEIRSGAVGSDVEGSILGGVAGDCVGSLEAAFCATASK